MLYRREAIIYLMYRPYFDAVYLTFRPYFVLHADIVLLVFFFPTGYSLIDH